MNTKQLKDLLTALESLGDVRKEEGPKQCVDGGTAYDSIPGITWSSGIEEHVPSPWEIGKAYYLRTVTHIITGRLCAISKTEIVVDQAAWIADTGRYADAMASGEFSEVEPYPANWKVIVNRAALIDAAQWPHALPCEQK